MRQHRHEPHDAYYPYWASPPSGDPPFTPVELLQHEAMLTTEQLHNLIGMELSAQWAIDVRQLMAKAQAQIDAILAAM
ncbi:MAG: hypothetical protein ABSC06_12305 [Rhodopila sp.]|jgi:hypothetical protein